MPVLNQNQQDSNQGQTVVATLPVEDKDAFFKAQVESLSGDDEGDQAPLKGEPVNPPIVNTPDSRDTEIASLKQSLGETQAQIQQMTQLMMQVIQGRDSSPLQQAQKPSSLLDLPDEELMKLPPKELLRRMRTETIAEMESQYGGKLQQLENQTLSTQVENRAVNYLNEARRQEPEFDSRGKEIGKMFQLFPQIGEGAKGNPALFAFYAQVGAEECLRRKQQKQQEQTKTQSGGSSLRPSSGVEKRMSVPTGSGRDAGIAEAIMRNMEKYGLA